MVSIPKIQQAYIIPYQKNYADCDNIIKRYGKQKTQELKTMVAEMYTPIIKQIAAKVALENGISAEDYAQKLYLRLFENLDIFAKTKTPASSLIKYLRREDPDENDIISMADIPYQKLPPEEVAKNFSYTIDKQLEQPGITEIVMNTVKKQTTVAEFSVISQWLEDKSLDEIGDKIGLTRERTRQLKEKGLRRIIHSDFRRKAKPLYYDDNKTGIPMTHPDTPEHLLVKKIQLPVNIDMEGLIKYGKDADKIRELTKDDYPGQTAWGTLNALLRRQGSYFVKRLLFSQSAQQYVESMLEKDPNYKIELSLNKEIDKKTFIPQARKISIEMFGKDIFNFI